MFLADGKIAKELVFAKGEQTESKCKKVLEVMGTMGV